MRKSKSIVSLLVILVIVMLFVFVFTACDLIGGGDSSTKKPSHTTETTDTPPDFTIPGQTTDGEDGSTTTRPRPPKPTTNDGTGSSGGSKVYTVDPIDCLAALIGGTRNVDTVGKYKTINFYADLDLPDKESGVVKKTRFSLRTNLDQVGNDNEVAIRVIDMSNVEEVVDNGQNLSTQDIVAEDGSIIGKFSLSISDIENQIEEEKQGELEWGVYIVGNKLFFEKDENLPLLYFEDFIMDYMLPAADALKNFISDGKYDGALNGEIFNLLGGSKDMVMTLIPLIMSLVFKKAVVTTTVDEITNETTLQYEMELKLNELVDTLSNAVDVVGLVAGALPFDLDLNPLVGFLNSWLPTMKIVISGKVTEGVTTEFNFHVDDIGNPNEPIELLDLDLGTQIYLRDTKLDLNIPERVYENVDFEPFSLTNIALSLDLILDTNGVVDLGAAINAVAGSTVLPTNLLVLEAATGIRLDAIIDFDLNYGKEVDENGDLLDRNLLSLELSLIDLAGNRLENDPLIGIYYLNGSAYINITVDHGRYADWGGLLGRYYQGGNIKIDLGGVPNIVQYIVGLVGGALDGVFKDTFGITEWVDFEDVIRSQYGDNSSTQEEGEQISAIEEDKPICATEVLAVGFNEEGEYHVSTDFISFLKGVGSAVGFGDIFGINDEKTAIVLTINKIFWGALTSLAKDLGAKFDWPGGLGAELFVEFNKEGHLDNITIVASLDGQDGFIDKDGYWSIGKKAAFKPLLFAKLGSKSTDDKYYSDVECEKAFVLDTEIDSFDNYSIIFIDEVNSKYFMSYKCNESTDKNGVISRTHIVYSNEVTVGSVEYIENNKKQYNTVVYDIDYTPSTIKASDMPSNTKYSAYIFKGKWVVGNGLDEGDYVDTGIQSQAMGIKISLHDFMFCYRTEHLSRFNPELGGVSYKGHLGAATNLEGFILSRTHETALAHVDSTSTGKYLIYENGGYREVILGTGVGEEEFKNGVEYYSIVERNYINSITELLDQILAGTLISLNIEVRFEAGKYNLAPLIGLFLPEIKDKDLIWEFYGDFDLDASLNIGLALNKDNTESSALVLELIANKDLVMKEQVLDANGVPTGALTDKVLFQAGEPILGIYGNGNKLFILLENIHLLNLNIPNLYMEIDYTTLLYTLLGNLLGGIGLDELNFNLNDLLFGNKEEAQSLSTSANINEMTQNAEAQGIDMSQALAILVGRDVVAVGISVGALEGILGMFMDEVPDIQSIFDFAIELNLNRLEGVYLDIGGILVPKVGGYNENDPDDKLVLKLQAGTTKAPVNIGNGNIIKDRYAERFEELNSGTKTYRDDLIQAIIALIGDLKVTLTIDAKTLSSFWDINKIIDTIVADRADTYDTPINISFDEWETEVQLNLQWSLDLDNFKNTQILLEILYEGNVWIGLYILNNSLVVDLNGIGLFDVEIVSLEAIANLGAVINALTGSIGSLTLTEIVGSLIGDLINPGEDNQESTEVEQQSDEIAVNTLSDIAPQADAFAVESEDMSNNLIALLLSSISIANFTISAHLTADVFEAIFRELLGFSMYLEFDVGLTADLINGKIGLNVGIERTVEADISLEIATGTRGQFRFEKDLNAIPDWNAMNGEYLINGILKNLELGLYIDLNQYTSTTGSAKYTRVYIEKLTESTRRWDASSKKLANTKAGKATKGNILVTLAEIDEKEFNNSGSGSLTPYVYIELDYKAGKLNLNICSNLVKFVVDIGDTVGPVSIDLDLVSMLSGTIDGLLESINGLVRGIVNKAEDISGVEIDISNGSNNGNNNNNNNNNTEVEEEYVLPTEDTIKVVEVISAQGWTNVQIVKNAGKYYTYDNKFYQINAQGRPEQLTVNTSYASERDIPLTNLESRVNTIYKITKQVIVNEVEEEQISYYICLPLKGSRRVFAYYKLELVNGLSGLFDGFDLLPFLDMINLYLNCDKTSKIGVLNADVTLNNYQFNSLIDNLLYYILGPETILNLQEMTADSDGLKFSDNYLAKVYWNRLDANATWDNIWDIVPNLLSDVVKGLANINIGAGLLGTLTNGLEGTIKNILTRLIPFAVTNETHLGVNIVRGQLANIYLTAQDHGEAILDPDGNVYKFHNGKKELVYSANNSRNGYYTNLYIFNTSPSVGDANYTGVSSAITWDNIPTGITYDPYMYASASAGYNEIVSKNFTNKVAKYQKGQDLYKANVSFSVVSFEPWIFDGAKWTYGAKQDINQALSQSSLDLTKAGIYTIKANAPFNNGNIPANLFIRIKVLSSSDIVEMEPISMFVYAPFPTTLYATTADGVERRFSTDLLKIYNNETGGNKVLDIGKYKDETSEDGSWDEIVNVQLPNGATPELTIHFKNSEVDQVVLEGANENNEITIDLYDFEKVTEEGKTFGLANYTPEKLFFLYNDGTAYSLPVEWINTQAAESLFDRRNANPGEGDTSGAKYVITAVIYKGVPGLEQEVNVTFVVPSRNPLSISFGEIDNTLVVQPYEYYMYKIDPVNNESYNPYKSQVAVNYEGLIIGDQVIMNPYQDMVYVTWSGIDNNINYNWNNENNDTYPATVSLDTTAYKSGDIFSWNQNVTVSMARNQIAGIYFDAELEQNALIIDPYIYNNLTSKYEFYPKTAYVKFTNGSVINMPIAWRKSEIDGFNVLYEENARQLHVAIGFDPSTYNLATGIVDEYSIAGSSFYQEFVVWAEVDGTSISDVILDGSELVGGTYKIDPISVNFLGKEMLPSIVDVVYVNGYEDTRKVVKWTFIDNGVEKPISEFELGLDAKKNISLKCYITNDLYFNVKAEVLARGASAMIIDFDEIKNTVINPFDYVIDKDGLMRYEIFKDKVDVQYETEYVIKLVDDVTTVIYLNESYKTYSEVVARKKEIRKLYNYENGVYTVKGIACSLVEDIVYTTYQLPITWDFERLNVSADGGDVTMYYFFGKGTSYEVEGYVDVEFAKKTIKNIESDDFIFEIYTNGDEFITISDEDVRNNTTTKKMNVNFEGKGDNQAYIDVVLDFSTLKLTTGYFVGSIASTLDNKTRYVYSMVSTLENGNDYYVKGKYIPVELKGDGNHGSYSYYTFTEVAYDDVTEGRYYINYMGNFCPVDVTTSNKSNSLRYYERNLVSDPDTMVGSCYEFHNKEYTFINIVNDSYKAPSEEYFTLSFDNEYEVDAIVASGTTMETSVKIKVHVLEIGG